MRYEPPKMSVFVTQFCRTRHIREIAINNGWNTQIVQILHEKLDGKFLFNINFLSRLPKPVGLSHEWIKTYFKYQEPEFYSRLFDEYVQRHIILKIST